MTIACYVIGKRFFPVPYNFLPMIVYSVVVMAIVLVSFYIQFNNTLLDVAFNLSIPAIMLILVYLVERKNILKSVDNK